MNKTDWLQTTMKENRMHTMCKSHKMRCIWPQRIKTNTMLVTSNIWFVYYRSQPLVNYTTNDNAWLTMHGKVGCPYMLGASDDFLLSMPWLRVYLALYSLASYSKISWSFEAARFAFRLSQSLWNVTRLRAIVISSNPCNDISLSPT